MLNLLIFLAGLPLEELKPIRQVNPSHFQMAKNVMLFNNSGNSIELFDIENGNKIHTISEEGYISATFGYFPSHDLIAVCFDSEKSTPGNSQSFIKFYTRAGYYMGKGKVNEHSVLNVRNNPTNIYIQQVINTRNKTFLNLADWPLMNDPDPKILHETVLERTAGGYEILLVGESFNRTTSLNSQLSKEFSLCWAVESSDGQSILVTSELFGNAFVYDEVGSSRYEEVKAFSLGLSKFTNPITTYKTSSTKKEWLSSFSKITGLYSYNGEYLVGYSQENNEERTNTLWIQRMDDKLQLIDSPVEFKNSFLVGVTDEAIYLVHREGQSFELERIESL